MDFAIIGSGPAALTAAIYAARAGFKTEVFEKNKIGGALTEIDRIENYPGFLGSGEELANNLKEQAKNAGAKISYGTCEKLSTNDSGIELIIDGEPVAARAVLVATGSEPKTLELDTDKPISYCALCDAPLYKGKNIAVIGGGNSAVQEALYLSKIVNKIVLYSHSGLKADAVLVDKIKTAGNIEIHENAMPAKAELDELDGVFVFIGKRPATTFMSEELLDEKGYIKTRNFAAAPGIFAAGDVRSGSTKQAITAAADGADAAIAAIEFLKSQK
jgi:thioredoxin reductase (NADPH)